MTDFPRRLIIGRMDVRPDFSDPRWEPWETLQAALDDPDTWVLLLVGYLNGDEGWASATINYGPLRHFWKRGPDHD